MIHWLLLHTRILESNYGCHFPRCVLRPHRMSVVYMQLNALRKRIIRRYVFSCSYPRPCVLDSWYERILFAWCRITLARKTMQWPNVLTRRTTRYPAYSKASSNSVRIRVYTHMYMYMSMSMYMYMIIYGLYTDLTELLRCTIISPHNIQLGSIDGKHNGVVRGEGLLQQAWSLAQLPRCH